MLNVDLLWHTPEIFYKDERQSSRPNWNDLIDQITSERANSPKSNITML